MLAVRKKGKWLLKAYVGIEIQQFMGKTLGEAVRLVERAREKVQ